MQRVARQGINLARLARELAPLLAVPQRDGWLFDEEDGRIDGRRLAQLVTSPAESRLFRQDRFASPRPSAVSLLVDCSGSMKGLIEPVATLADILLRALDMAGVDSEVLGFTTGAWNGGRPIANGWPGPAAGAGAAQRGLPPGVQAAGRNWRRARAGIAALLKADLFREGIDGEAVDWACERLLARTRGTPHPDRGLRRLPDGQRHAGQRRLLPRQPPAEVVARRERQGARSRYSVLASASTSAPSIAASPDISPAL
jgi:cobaltochelatase CobT